MHKHDHNENEFLREIAPKLFERKIEIDEDAPAGYFESFPGKVIPKLVDSEKATTRRWKLINYRNVGIAAGLALILGLMGTYRLLNPSQKVQPLPDALDPWAANEFTPDPEMAYAYLEDDFWIDSTVFELRSTSLFAANLNDDELIEYLLEEEDLSYDLIYEENL